MRRLLLLTCFVFNYCTCNGQDIYKVMQEYDTARLTKSKIDIFYKYYSSTLDSIPLLIIKLAEVENLFKKKNDLKGVGIINLAMSNKYSYFGDYTNSLRHGLIALKNFEDIKDSFGIIQSLFLSGNALVFSKNYEQALPYLQRAAVLVKNPDNINYSDVLNTMAYCMILLNKPDSAFAYIKPAIDIGWKMKDTESLAYYVGTLGEAYLANKKYDLAKPLILESFQYSIQKDMEDLLANNSNDLSQLFYEIKVYDSSVYYAKRGVHYAGKRANYLLPAYEWLYKAFEKQEQKDSVSKYFRLAVALRDSFYSTENNKTVQALNFQKELWEREKQQTLIQAEKDYKSRLGLYSSLGVLAIIIVIAGFLYRNNQQQKKSKQKVEAAYAELKSTQAQLIQSEKMASLGELTAGIAHEIQNPLNFVNNFSEVSNELVEELKSEKAKPKSERDDQLENEILSDISNNLEKINHHGKRADAIVKGMLQHSRKSEGTKELTDINKLCDEYIRLSYHGLRAKDKNLNADFKTDFDETISKINIVPQDIGRVLLNLFNNAFYAASLPSEGGFSEPGKARSAVVLVSTKKKNNGIEIKVSDNGPGIPSNIIDKIFQPFFTTKPTGQGTGLGLSLAYDIITKEHNGSIKVESKEGEGTVFIISLPQNFTS